MSSQGTNDSSTNLKVIKTELKASGEAVQLVRPIATTSKSAEEIIGELVNQFDYKSKPVKASENELNAVQQAFGSNLAQELLKTYDGSNLTADSQQDLVGDRYLAKQIEIIQHQQKTSSILDKWSHLLYEGEKDDTATTTSVAASSSAATSSAAQHQQQQQQQTRQNIEATSLRVINKSSSYNSLLAKQQQRQIEDQIHHAQLISSQQHMQATTPTPQQLESLRHSRSGNNYASVQTLISNQFQNRIESQRQSASEIQSLMETQQISIGSGTVEESRRQSAQTSIGSTALEEDVHHSRRQSMHTSLGSGTIQESRRSSALDDLSRRQSAHTGISSAIEESSRLHSTHTSAIEESSRRQSGHMSNLSSAIDESESSRRQSTNTQSVLDSSHGQYTSVGSSVLEETQSRRQSAHTSIALSGLEQSRLQSIHTSIGSSVMEETSSRRQSTQASRASSMREHARAQALLEEQASSQVESDQAEYRAEYERHYDQAQANLNRSRSHTAQQPQPYLPQLTSSNLNAVHLDAYDSPQFKAMLDQLLKPLNLPPEQINYPADWPSQDKIHLLAEPIYIPAPQPIVIPAPNILTIQNHPLEKTYSQDLPQDAIKPTVTYYPTIASDQAHMKGFGIRQINTN